MYTIPYTFLHTMPKRQTNNIKYTMQHASTHDSLHESKINPHYILHCFFGRCIRFRIRFYTRFQNGNKYIKITMQYDARDGSNTILQHAILHRLYDALRVGVRCMDGSLSHPISTCEHLSCVPAAYSTGRISLYHICHRLTQSCLDSWCILSCVAANLILFGIF